MKPKIDPETEEKVRRILAASRMRGADPVAALNMSGLLRHPETIKADWITCLDAAILSVEDTPAGMFPRSALPKTPMDMKHAILVILEGMRERMSRDVSEK